MFILVIVFYIFRIAIVYMLLMNSADNLVEGYSREYWLSATLIKCQVVAILALIISVMVQSLGLMLSLAVLLLSIILLIIGFLGESIYYMKLDNEVGHTGFNIAAIATILSLITLLIITYLQVLWLTIDFIRMATVYYVADKTIDTIASKRTTVIE